MILMFFLFEVSDVMKNGVVLVVFESMIIIYGMFYF